VGHPDHVLALDRELGTQQMDAYGADLLDVEIEGPFTGRR
jgi:hypothetical protein